MNKLNVIISVYLTASIIALSYLLKDFIAAHFQIVSSSLYVAMIIGVLISHARSIASINREPVSDDLDLITRLGIVENQLDLLVRLRVMKSELESSGVYSISASIDREIDLIKSKLESEKRAS